MSNRLLELENSLIGATPTKRKRTAKRRHKAAKTAPPKYTAAASRRVARALSAVDYRVPGSFAAVKQPSGMTCWATVTTMMMSWREQKSLSIPTAIGKVGSSWLAMFTADQGLPSSKKAPFLSAAGLSYQLPQSLTAAGWEGLLRRYGPLWVTTDEDPSANFAIHARIMTGIRGDGTEAGTTIDVVDPATGTSYQENFGKFRQKYESEALDPKRPVRIQIVHWPHDAGFNVLRSLSEQAETYAAGLAVSGTTTIDDAEFEPEYDEANPGKRRGRARSSFSASLAGTAPMTAADARWAADAVSPDYRHIAVAIDTKPFTLTAAIVGRLIKCNRFSLDGVDSKVIFGLRGCTLDADVSAFTDNIVLKEIEPNHVDNRCVLGVLDNVNRKITAFQASTVPNWEYMERYRQNHSKKANMLPTGRYIMVVGTHRPKKKDASGTWVDNPGRIQGALRQEQRVVVLRSEDDLTYVVKDTWDETVPNDNIHPGIVAVNAGSSTVPDYSSAGCNTIPGGSVGDQPSGAWADFRKALGLDNASPTANDGKKFAYVLLTGREARLMTVSGAQPITRLRFGSSGDEVRSLQDALAKHAKKFYSGKSDGEFGAGTSSAFIKYQKDRDSGAADAIVTPTDATALGFTLASPPATVAPLGITDELINLGKRLFNKIKGQRANEGLYKVTSDTAELLHQDTAATVQWKRTTANFTIRALAPDTTVKDVIRSLGDTPFLFKHRLEFEHNGFDIKNARILREIQGSTEMKSGKFETTWTAKNATPANVEVGRIDFLLKGLWDPGRGDKSVQDFSGKLWVDSEGGMRFDLAPNTRVKEEFFAGGTWSNAKTEKLMAPKLIKKWHSVFFPVNKHVLENDQLQSVKDWLRTLRPVDATDVSSPTSVRWQRLRSGAIPVTVEGHASATASGKYNQELSGKRADAVIKLLRDELGTGAKIERFAHGEENPITPTKQEKEADNDRRADIWYVVSR